MSSLPLNRTKDFPSKATIESHLQEFLGDKYDENYDIVEFVKAVWGFSPSEIPDRDGGYTLDTTACASYHIGLFNHKANGQRRRYKHNPPPKAKEHDAYVPLMSIIQGVEDQVRESMGIKDDKRRANLVNMKDRVVEGDFAETKPDFAWTWISGKWPQSWTSIAVCGELKKEKARANFEQAVGQICVEALTPTPPTVAVPEAPESPISGGTPEATSAAPSVGEKRRRPSPDAGVQDVREPKRSRSASNASTASSSAQPVMSWPSKKRAQILKYLTELGSHGVRSYVTGFLIEECYMSLWYMDRMGVVESCPFNFMLEPHFLLLFVAAINAAPLSKLGFFPMLRFPHTMSNTEEADERSDDEPHHFHNHFHKVSLELPDAYDIKLTGHIGLIFDLDIRPGRHIVNTHGTVGRATVVLPVVARGELAQHLCGEGELVSKISWHFRGKEGEDMLTEAGCVRAARVALASHSDLKHIVDMKFLVSRTMEQMDLPRAFMHDLRSINTRDCHVLIMSAYLPLKKVESPEELKQAFVGALRGHNAVYTFAHILHRDVSVSNIMFHRPNGTVVGVMCDWDQATSQTESPSDIDDIYTDIFKSDIPPQDLESYGFPPATATAKSPTSFVAPFAAPSAGPAHAPRYRSGTGPFIAIDILTYANIPKHLYRHDLESFFWVLIWILASFNPKTYEIGWIRSWLDAELPKIGGQKREFLIFSGAFEGIIASADEEYMRYFRAWIVDLRSLVSRVNRKYMDFQADCLTPWLEAKKAGIRKQAKCKKLEKDALELVKARENILTYEAFMECLDEDLPIEP